MMTSTRRDLPMDLPEQHGPFQALQPAHWWAVARWAPGMSSKDISAEMGSTTAETVSTYVKRSRVTIGLTTNQDLKILFWMVYAPSVVPAKEHERLAGHLGW